jgi:hypothetical protein
LLQDGVTVNKRSIIFGISFFVAVVTGLYFLQCYRDNTRYGYYYSHYDHQKIPTAYTSGWEFLDNLDEHRTIALTMGDNPPGGNWFFYPLLGRKLQNDIVYLSAKHKWKVPTWVDRGLLRGKNFNIWADNLKKQKVDYVFVVKPWPIELQWIQRNEELFQLVFYHKEFRIYKYAGNST